MISLPNPTVIQQQMKELDQSQLFQLKESYIELILDNMDTDSLVHMCRDLLLDAYEDSNAQDLQEEILDLYDDETLEDLLTNVDT